MHRARKRHQRVLTTWKQTSTNREGVEAAETVQAYWSAVLVSKTSGADSMLRSRNTAPSERPSCQSRRAVVVPSRKAPCTWPVVVVIPTTRTSCTAMAYPAPGAETSVVAPVAAMELAVHFGSEAESRFKRGI